MSKRKKPNPDQRGRPPTPCDADVLACLDEYEGPGTVHSLIKWLNISSNLYYRWMREEPNFARKVKQIKDRANDLVENALFKRAVGYNQPLTKERFDRDGQVQQLVEVHHFAPDPGAAMNWLKNRRPEEWRDKTTIEVDGDHIALLQRMLEKDKSNGN